MREMNEKVLNHYDAMTVGELPHTEDPKKVLDYVRASDKQLNMIFQFDIVSLGQGGTHKYHFQPWKLTDLKKTVDKWQKFIDGTDGWTTTFCENHDQGRSLSRYACDSPQYRTRSSKLLATMICALTGTLFIYQGQEIGMINMPDSWTIDDCKDIESVNFYRTAKEARPADQEYLDYVMRSIRLLGRDNPRLPMQWDGSAFAGFTEAEKGAWMRVHDAYPEINVARQLGDEASPHAFWKRMVQFRKDHRELLVHGTFDMLDAGNEQTFVFTKSKDGKKAVVALNFTGEEQKVELPRLDNLRLALGNCAEDEKGEKGGEQSGGSITLKPWEARLYLDH